MTKQRILDGVEVVAFVEQSLAGSNDILAVQPIPADGSAGYTFVGDDYNTTLDVYGVDSRRGQRVIEAYHFDELPTDDRETLNRVLRPDEFDEEVDSE